MDANQSDTPKPRDGETQPDFAIRFHESMMDKIPDTEARTQQCFREWRNSVGVEPEVLTARKYHKDSEYVERENIPVFEEHVIPARRSKDGTRVIPAVKYDKRALAAIVRNMNEQIADVGKFCPITNGHTSDNTADPEPEVLAYSGTHRLGMIGNKKPRYAIFADEYHRKDREEILKGRRGRSVEVLPLPDVHARTFYPIAALGADEPRLNLPPARYHKTASGEELEVERYMMVAPGGSSTFIPSDDRDKYEDDENEQDMPNAQIRSTMEAFFASAPVQWVMQKMEEEGKAGSVNPLVHQPPPMADMQADPNAPPQPGQQPGQAPGQQPGMDPMGGDDPDMDDFNMDDSDESPGDAMPGQQPAAGNLPPKGKKPMTEPVVDQNKDQYSVKSAGLQALEARMTALEQENAGLRAKLIGAERYSKLSSLKQQGIEFDLTNELGRVATQTDEQFAGHVETIEKYYRRSPVAVADFSELHGAGRQSEVSDASNGVDELSAGDAEHVMKYAMRHNEANKDNQISYIEARERYIATKKTSASTAG